MKLKYITILLLVTFIIFAFDLDSLAQCAMCKANVKSNNDMSNTTTFGRHLNPAILYLMTVPYLLIMGVGYVFFKERVDAWIKVKYTVFTGKVFRKSTETQSAA